MSHDDPQTPAAPRRSAIAAAFRDREGKLRNGWWVAAFLALLAALLFQTILISARLGHEITIWDQVLLIAGATVAIQLLRRKPITEVTGTPNLGALLQLATGLALGFLLMAIPAAVLWFAGWVRFDMNPLDVEALGAAVALMAGVAIAEELLFRGVLFQRLIAGVGLWPAQIAVGLLFVLTHMGNPGMQGATLVLAGVNIFLASLLFGQAFVRTRGLALPVGLHFMANVTQGVLFGFGVSGNAEPGLLRPEFRVEADWLTGGAFGLEASIVGLLILIALLGWFVLKPGKPGQSPD